MNRLDNKDYEKSNKLETVALSRFDKHYMAKVMKSETLKDRQVNSQLLLDYLCDKFGIPHCKLTVTDATRPQKTTKRGTCTEYGHYVTHKYDIVIYNTTPARKQVVAIKTFVDTLIHEFIHHYDMTYLHFSASPHTCGFYKRISDLKAKLM